ncbi:MAG: hypothetical protein M1814_002348 [Vezdaea aestivalis]|nr:MAG: hypothetical protein M1814_002348 [Vezdaea aestivalis]
MDAEPAPEADSAPGLDPSIAAPPQSSTSDPTPPSNPSPTPGPRARALQTVYSSALNHTLTTLSYPNFAACFPTAARYVPKALAALHLQTVGKLEAFAQKEFDAILAERDVISSLNALDGVLASARAARAEAGDAAAPPQPTHMLAPEQIAAAQLKPYLVAHRGKLNAAIQNVGAANERLAEEVRGQRREIEELLRGVEAVVRDLESAGREVGGIDLRKEGVDVEADLKGLG